MSAALALFFWLMVGHALADYPLQGDFLAKAKNHRNPLPGVPWIHGLLWHSVIHGGAVALVTGSLSTGCAEIVCHAVIDKGKSEGIWQELVPRGDETREVFEKRADRVAFHVDQMLHVLCKVAWVLVARLA